MLQLPSATDTSSKSLSVSQTMKAKRKTSSKAYIYVHCMSLHTQKEIVRMSENQINSHQMQNKHILRRLK
jgi:hypothetical protein